MGTLVQGLDFKKPFGASVRAWRGRLAISQEELAGRAGLHRTYVCDVERGARNVSLGSIEKLARALEISTATLFSYGQAPGQPETPRFGEAGLVDILFVEDDPEDVKMAMMALKGITNRVQVVHTGETALDFLFCTGEFGRRQPSQRPQLILLDLALPKMDGLEVLERVKSDQRTAAIPVVVLTGSEREHDIQTSKRLGAAAYILKPVDMVNLTHVAPLLHLQWALLKPPPALHA
jgi:CheY-like chemotaxis protein/DNA-binding XRE family transcriptional regulator